MANKKRVPYGTSEDRRDQDSTIERACFSDRLERLRLQHDLSYEELARLTEGNVSKSALRDYVARKSEPGKLIILISLAQVFHCSVDYLLGLTDEVSEPQAKGMPEYLGLTPEAVQAIHESSEYAGEMYRQQTGLKAFSGLFAFSKFLEKYALEFFGDLAGLTDVQIEIGRVTEELSKIKPSELDVGQNMEVLREVETLQHKLVYAENRFQTLIRRAMNSELNLDDNKAALDQLHQMLVQQQTNPDSVFYKQMLEYAKTNTEEPSAEKPSV